MDILWTWEFNITKIDIRLLPYLRKSFFLSLPDNYLDDLVSVQSKKPSQSIYFVVSDIDGETNSNIKSVDCKFMIQIEDELLDSESEDYWADILANWKAKFYLELSNPQEFLR